MASSPSTVRAIPTRISGALERSYASRRARVAVCLFIASVLFGCEREKTPSRPATEQGDMGFMAYHADAGGVASEDLGAEPEIDEPDPLGVQRYTITTLSPGSIHNTKTTRTQTPLNNKTINN